jgi:bifunctional ADP-heptose synthase (sugar kinase/adenylyltransferase)
VCVFRDIEKQIITLDDLPTIRQRATRTKTRLIFTEGFWDLFHDEHAQYLMKCKRLGGWLVVGVVQDNQMFPNKGRHPHYDEQRRLYTIAALANVDWAVLLCDPVDVILALKPNIVVISPGSLKDRNANKRECVKRVGARLIEIGSKDTIHSSDVARRLAQGG